MKITTINYITTLYNGWKVESIEDNIKEMIIKNTDQYIKKYSDGAKKYCKISKFISFLACMPIIAYLFLKIEWYKSVGFNMLQSNFNSITTVIGLLGCVLFYEYIFHTVVIKNIKTLSKKRQFKLVAAAVGLIVAEAFSSSAVIYGILSLIIISGKLFVLPKLYEAQSLYKSSINMKRYIMKHKIDERGISKIFAENKDYGIKLTVSFIRDDFDALKNELL